MPRSVEINYPDKTLDELEVMAKVLGRSFSSTLIKMVKVGIEASQTMSIEDINGSKK